MIATRDSAVRLYAPDHPDLANTVAARLFKIMDDLGRQISEGYAQDWPDYKFRVGQINGMRIAIEQCQDIDREMRG